jgi:hypothetical protein
MTSADKQRLHAHLDHIPATVLAAVSVADRHHNAAMAGVFAPLATPAVVACSTRRAHQHDVSMLDTNTAAALHVSSSSAVQKVHNIMSP